MLWLLLHLKQFFNKSKVKYKTALIPPHSRCGLKNLHGGLPSGEAFIAGLFLASLWSHLALFRSSHLNLHSRIAFCSLYTYNPPSLFLFPAVYHSYEHTYNLPRSQQGGALLASRLSHWISPFQWVSVHRCLLIILSMERFCSTYAGN